MYLKLTLKKFYEVVLRILRTNLERDELFSFLFNIHSSGFSLYQEKQLRFKSTFSYLT